MSKTTIEWTDFTWSPIRAKMRPDASVVAITKGYDSLVPIAQRILDRMDRGKHSGFGQHCEHVSPGCKNCYAETNAGRCLPENGLGLPFDRRSRDLVEIACDEDALVRPLSWKKPQKIFVENQSDLFGEWVPDALIDRAFAVMALTPQHTYQILTKRADRMREYFTAKRPLTDQRADVLHYAEHIGKIVWDTRGDKRENYGGCGHVGDISNRRVPPKWPLPSVWLGVSVENQEYADKRIPDLLATPAEVRFVSYEPALGPVDWQRAAAPHYRDATVTQGFQPLLGIDWVIVGGESGPGARPFDVAWARQTIAQCYAAGVACFVKQLGRTVAPVDLDACGIDTYLWAAARAGLSDGEALDRGTPIQVNLGDPKGGAIEEWPECVQVREWPA